MNEKTDFHNKDFARFEMEAEVNSEMAYLIFCLFDFTFLSTNVS